jgi:energy-coupling factor transporter transmembrane protein EcfT
MTQYVNVVERDMKKKENNKSNLWVGVLTQLILLITLFVTNDNYYLLVGMMFTLSVNVINAIPSLAKKKYISVLMLIIGVILMTMHIVLAYQAKHGA